MELVEIVSLCKKVKVCPISKKLLKDIQKTMQFWHGAYENVSVSEYDEHGCAHVTFIKTNGESIVYKTWNNGFGDVIEEIQAQG